MSTSQLENLLALLNARPSRRLAVGVMSLLGLQRLTGDQTVQARHHHKHHHKHHHHHRKPPSPLVCGQVCPICQTCDVNTGVCGIQTGGNGLAGQDCPAPKVCCSGACCDPIHACNSGGTC